MAYGYVCLLDETPLNIIKCTICAVQNFADLLYSKINMQIFGKAGNLYKIYETFFSKSFHLSRTLKGRIGNLENNFWQKYYKTPQIWKHHKAALWGYFRTGLKSDWFRKRLVTLPPLFFTPSLMMLASSFHSAENVNLDRNIRTSYLRSPETTHAMLQLGSR